MHIYWHTETLTFITGFVAVLTMNRLVVFVLVYLCRDDGRYNVAIVFHVRPINQTSSEFNVANLCRKQNFDVLKLNSG